MRCPNPQCAKEITISGKDIDKYYMCPHCSARLATEFDVVDFLNKNVNLFTIFGIFAAIAIILPSFSLYSVEILNKTAPQSFFTTPPVIVKLSILDVLTNLFILGCGMVILFLFTLILGNLFGGQRNRELIYWEWRGWQVRTADFARYLFGIPFLILSMSMIMYIAIITGDFFQFYMIAQVAFFALLFFLIYRQSPLLFKDMLKDD